MKKKSSVNGVPEISCCSVVVCVCVFSFFVLFCFFFFFPAAPPICLQLQSRCDQNTRTTCGHLYAAEWMMTPTSNESFLQSSECERAPPPSIAWMINISCAERRKRMHARSPAEELMHSASAALRVSVGDFESAL